MEQARRRLGGVPVNERLSLIGAAACGIAVAHAAVRPARRRSRARLGFVVVAYVVFLGAYTVLMSMSDEGPAVRDRVMTVLLYTAAVDHLRHLGHRHRLHVAQGSQRAGARQLLHPGHDQGRPARSADGRRHQARAGRHALDDRHRARRSRCRSGLVAAVYLNEIGGRFSRFVRTIVDAMTALPSIVAGLFIYATWILTLGREKSALAAALAISVMMLPIMIRTADVVLRLVPGNLREASAALGRAAVAHGVARRAAHGAVRPDHRRHPRAPRAASARPLPVLLTAGLYRRAQRATRRVGRTCRCRSPRSSSCGRPRTPWSPAASRRPRS